MLRGLGLLLPVLVLGGLLHPEVVLAGDRTSFHMCQVLTTRLLCYKLVFLSEMLSECFSASQDFF